MKKFIALLFAASLFFSCSPEKIKSSENYIEEFSIDGIKPMEIKIRPIPKLIYIWTEPSNYENLVRAKRDIKISENATLDSTGQIWTNAGFRYIVTAENGEKREYSVKIDTTIIPKKYNFESWALSNDTVGYYELSDMRWASGNQGIGMALALLSRDANNPENYPTKRTSESYSGDYAVLLETIEGGSVFGKNIPIFSGNLFLGNFNIGKAISDELAATEFGKLYLTKPKRITGYYKYKEGEGASIDSCDIYAGFYQASDDYGNEIILTAKDKDDLNKFLAYARLPDCSTTAGDGFHQFVLNFDTYKSEPAFAKYDYKLFITFAASKRGAAYEGKIGSKLIVDEVEIEDY